MDEWLTKAADGLGIREGLPAGEVDALLDLARIAAHESGDRKNAPLVCYLAGLAAARDGKSVDELVTAVRRSTS